MKTQYMKLTIFEQDYINIYEVENYRQLYDMLAYMGLVPQFNGYDTDYSYYHVVTGFNRKQANNGYLIIDYLDAKIQIENLLPFTTY